MRRSLGPTAVAGGTTFAEGQVRAVQVRSENRGENQTKEIWTFRIERYDSEGNRILLVPVEMRGRTFEGSINDGDWVRARGRVRSGTLRVSRLENLSTGASVLAKGLPRAAKVSIAFFILFMLGWFGFLAYMQMNPGPGFSGP
ncbi:hypothetical protein [Streptomyces sp. NPDC004721]